MKLLALIAGLSVADAKYTAQQKIGMKLEIKTPPHHHVHDGDEEYEDPHTTTCTMKTSCLSLSLSCQMQVLRGSHDLTTFRALLNTHLLFSHAGVHGVRGHA